MRTQIDKVLKLQNFFTLKECCKTSVKYSLNKSSQLVLHNIYKNWLQSIYAKSHQNFPVYLSKKISELKETKSKYYGYIDHCVPKQVNEISIGNDNENFTVSNNSVLKLTIVIPQRDINQYFIQWQRYRKYWWSSVSTITHFYAFYNKILHDNNL